MAGIVGYGSFVPFNRISVDDIYNTWRNVSLSQIKTGFGLTERAVLQPNEDTITLGVAAGERALSYAGIRKDDVDAVFLGTYTNPYDSRPSVTIVQEALGLKYGCLAADIQFSGKSGTTALQISASLVESGMAKYALAIGSDTVNRHTSPGRASEYAASAGAVALLVGEKDVIAEISGAASYSSDLSDQFRVEGDRYIQSIGDGGKVYPAWEIGYVEHVTQAVRRLLDKTGLSTGDFAQAVFQQPYPVIPGLIGERLGFTKGQIELGNVAGRIGDCGSASSLLGLANVLDVAKPGQRILLASYGFGAGADAICLTVTDAIKNKKPALTTEAILANKMLIDYATAARLEYKYAQDAGPLYV